VNRFSRHAVKLC